MVSPVAILLFQLLEAPKFLYLTSSSYFSSSIGLSEG